MKKLIAGLCLTLLLATTLQVRAQVIYGFNDIVAWAGTGANQSALVIQWNDTKSPVALTWGFRWDTGAAPTVNDMLLRVMQADVGLFARGDSATQYGAAAYYGLGYSQSGTLAVTGAQDPGGNSTAVVFVNGFSDMNVSSNATEAPWSSTGARPANSANRYQEGWWDNGYWAQLDGVSGTSYSSAAWTASWTGTSESLVNNGWYGFTFGGVDSDYNSTAPLPATIYAAVPEPVTLPLMLLAAGIILLYARKRLYAC